MPKLTDEQLIDEIRQRFEFNRNALNDMRAMTRKLEVMNEKLKESEALKSQFLSNIRNEINNPLSAIMGLSGQFFARACDPETCRRAIGMIHSEAFNLDFQLQNIFLAAELEAGEAVPSYAMVDMAGVLEGCLDKLKFRIADREMQVSTPDCAGLVFPTDAQMFEAVLLNLLANAVEFGRRGGLVAIGLEESADALTLVLEDDGPGIDADHREAIFDRFRQLEAGSTKSHPGHGLGLSLCRSLAELLGGAVSVDDRPGGGSRFTCTLPRPDGEVAVFASEGNLFLFEPMGGDAETF